MMSAELDKDADGRVTGAVMLPQESLALQPAPTSPACRIIRRGAGESARQAEFDGREEILGYVVEGRALLEIDGQRLMLEPGDCVVLPKGARRRFSVLEPMTMIESPMLPQTAGGKRS